MDLQIMSDDILVGFACCFKAAVQDLSRGKQLPQMEQASDSICIELDLSVC